MSSAHMAYQLYKLLMYFINLGLQYIMIKIWAKLFKSRLTLTLGTRGKLALNEREA